ncbi:MAG: four helix bundle protein [Terracidiphilus sp.]
MERPKSYQELIVYQKAMSLARHAHQLSRRLPKSELFGLSNQISRAAVSVPSNIAEGYGRLTDLQFRHFLGNARRSLYELQTQVQLAADFGYFDNESVRKLLEQSSEVARLINGLLSSLSQHSQAAEALVSSANSANSASPANKGFHR